MKIDHERIWLQNAEDAKHCHEGRMWCEDKVWPNDPEDGEPTEYVRADLLAAARNAALEEAEKALRELIDGLATDASGMLNWTKVAEIPDTIRALKGEG